MRPRIWVVVYSQVNLYCKKPILGLPLFGDQHYNASRLVDLGVGLRLDKSNLTVHQVRIGIAQLLSDKGRTEALSRLGTIQSLCKGLDRAADTLEEVLSVGVSHLIHS